MDADKHRTLDLLEFSCEIFVLTQEERKRTLPGSTSSLILA